MDENAVFRSCVTHNSSPDSGGEKPVGVVPCYGLSCRVLSNWVLDPLLFISSVCISHS